MKLTRKIRFISATFVSLVLSLHYVFPTFAIQSFSLSPMNESIILSPGDTYHSAFKVNNISQDEDFHYEATVGPYYVDQDYSPVFTNEGDKNQIVNWITINPESVRGVVKPNETVQIEFTINVPEDAAGGGQYACISVGSDSSVNGVGGNAAITESLAIGYTIFAEITGVSVVSGEIQDMVIPSFILDGKIHAESLVKNTGNVHSIGKYRLQVKSAFSDEVLYDSSKDIMEGDDMHTVFPERTYKEEEYWNDTPMMGIFNVSYSVEFQGKTSEVSSIVIVCPWWLLVLFGIGILLMTMRIIVLIKLGKRKKHDKSMIV